MRLIFTAALCALFSNGLIAQTPETLTLQPGVNDGYFANISSITPTENANIVLPELPITDWTTNGQFTVTRCYQKFDFSQLPANATIQSAYLNLYADSIATNGIEGEPTYGTQNACGIYRIVESWDRDNLTWNTQPQYSESSYVPLLQSTSSNEDYTNINVTQMVDSMVYGNNYGLVIKLMQETTKYNSMIFYSPSTAIPYKQPKLVINYTVPTGVTNVTNKDAIDVFPNPAINNITVKITIADNSDLKMCVTDCLGKILKLTTVSKNDYSKGINVDIHTFYPGIYTISVENKNGSVISKKFVVN